jgi:hypothetical protein
MIEFGNGGKMLLIHGEQQEKYNKIGIQLFQVFKYKQALKNMLNLADGMILGYYKWATKN